MSWDSSSGTEAGKMDAVLECLVSLGQFTGEYAVKIATVDGEILSLFVPKSEVEIEKNPRSGRYIKGLLRVEVVEEKDDIALVLLPRVTLENGQHALVNSELIRQEA